LHLNGSSFDKLITAENHPVRSPQRIIVIAGVCIAILLSCGHLNTKLNQGDRAGEGIFDPQDSLQVGQGGYQSQNKGFSGLGTPGTPDAMNALLAFYGGNSGNGDAFDGHEKAFELLNRLANQDLLKHATNSEFFLTPNGADGIDNDTMAPWDFIDYIFPDDQGTDNFQPANNEYFWPSFYIPDPVRAGYIPSITPPHHPRDPQNPTGGAAPVPEPSTIIIFGVSLLALTAMIQKKSRAIQL
jgi:hypothetical protein